MPYSDPIKKEEWKKRHNAERRKQRQLKRAENQFKLGHHTKESLAWPKPKLSKCFAMWVAACIDCEGCLVLGSYKHKGTNSYAFHVSAQLQMTEYSIPERLVEICGGTVHFSIRKSSNKPIIAWHLGANGTRWLLPQIIDHLLIKRRQAELLIEFLTISKRGNKRAADDGRAHEIRLEMSTLNRRGVPVGTGKTSEPLMRK